MFSESVVVYLWLGILSGLLLSYLIEKIGRRRKAGGRGRLVRWKKVDSLQFPERVLPGQPLSTGKGGAKNKLAKRLRIRFLGRISGAAASLPRDWQAVFRRWPVWAGWAVVALFGLLASLAIIHSIYLTHLDSSLDTGGFYRLAQNVIAPFVSGLLIGIVLMQLMLSVEWPFLATLAGLGIALLLALVLTKDPSLSLLDQLKTASVAGVSLDFSGSGRPSAEEGAYARTAVDFGDDRTGYALLQLRAFPEFMKRDEAYMGKTGFQKGVDTYPLEKQKIFAQRIIVPTASKLMDLRDVPPNRDVWSLAERRLSSDLRVAMVGTDSNRRHIARIRQLFKTLDGLWERMCEELPSPDCNLTRSAVARAGRVTLLTMTSNFKKRVALMRNGRINKRPAVRVFDRNHPYGVVLSSLVLLMAGDEDAAIADVEAWLAEARPAAEQEGPDSFRWIGLYRAYYLQSYTLARRAFNPVYLNAAVETLRQANRIGKRIAEESWWAPQFRQGSCGLPPTLGRKKLIGCSSKCNLHS